MERSRSGQFLSDIPIEQHSPLEAAGLCDVGLADCGNANCPLNGIA